MSQARQHLRAQRWEIACEQLQDCSALQVRSRHHINQPSLGRSRNRSRTLTYTPLHLSSDCPVVRSPQESWQGARGTAQRAWFAWLLALRGRQGEAGEEAAEAELARLNELIATLLGPTQPNTLCLLAASVP